MKIFYYCYGSAHSSVVAASIHLGMIPTDKIPTAVDFQNLPHYDKTPSDKIGTPFFMGSDEYENNIYIIGMGPDRDLVKKTIKSYLKYNDRYLEDSLMISTLECVNFKTKLGGFLSRRLGFVSLGRPLTIKGIQEKYYDFVKLVKKVKTISRANINVIT